MDKLSIRLMLLTTLAASTLSACATQAIRVDIRNLAKEKNNLIGKHISAHGCLTNTPHGEFIGPCGSYTWREITSILDTDDRGLDAFQKLGIDYSRLVEGDFSGRVVERAVDWPQHGNRVFLELESVSNIRAYEP